MTAAMTLGINLLIVALFVAWEGITPQLDWILLVPLLLELYLFTLGTALILTTLFIPLRDIGQAWDLVSPALLRVAGHLPGRAPSGLARARRVPVAVHAGDARRPLPHPLRRPLGHDRHGARVLGPLWRLLPIATRSASLGLAVFKRHERWFAERT